MNFKTRPHFEDRQIVQRVGESIRLSGDTLYSTTGGLIVEPTVLDFTGSTTGQTTVTINDLTGYLNNDNRLSGLIVNPPVLKLSGSTGTTTVNVENFVLKAIDSNGSAAWSPISGISWSVSACTSPFLTTDIQPCTPGGTITVNAGNLEVNNSLRINDGTQSNGYVFTSDGSGNGSWQPSYEFTGNTSGGCITDIFVTNVHSCSPLNINPLDEGNVYFGSTSGITIDVINNRLGINNPNPLYTLDISGTTGEKLEFQTSSTVPRLLLSVNESNRLNRVAVIDTTNNAGVEMGFRGSTEPSFPAYGKQGDSFIRAGNTSNGLNIIEAPTAPFENYIRFFAGQNANTTPDIHIQGSGSTRGFVGINNATPTERLDVVGKTKTTNFQMTNGATNGYVLTSDSLGNATWQLSSGGGSFTGNTSASCITDLYISNLYGCSPITVWDSMQSVGSTASGTTSFAFGINNVSSGIASFAEGGNNISSGDASHAEGLQTTASGDGSHAEGGGTNAIGLQSHAEGKDTVAIGDYSHAEGQGTYAIGSYSHSEGLRTSATTVSSHAEGYETLVSGNYSHAEGYQTTASGDVSHAEGVFTDATGDYSHAEGQNTTASGYASHSEGDNTTASGAASHAEGLLTVASGTFSHAGGSSSTASGNYSFVHGYNSVALSENTIVFGEGITGTSSNTVYVPYLNINTLGTGTSINNLGIDSSGGVVVGTPVETVVIGSISQMGTSAPTLVIGKNNTGATITPSRTSPGEYLLTASAPVFTAGGTFPIIAKPGNSYDWTARIGWDSTTEIAITTNDGAGVVSDGILDETTFVIHIF